jgi:hypothetical protein
MQIRRKLAVALGVAVVVVGGVSAAGMAYASGDGGEGGSNGDCVATGPLTKAVGPNGSTDTREQRSSADGPLCVPAVPAAPPVSG